MSITAHEGPLVIFDVAAAAGGIGYAQDYNPQNGPSLGGKTFGMMDTRLPFRYQPGQSDTRPFYGFTGGLFPLIDQTPSALAANNIAASQVPVAGIPLTLVSVTGAGITVGASVINANTGVLVTGLLAIDGAHGGVAFGTAGTVNIWDPTTAISRCVRVHSNGNDTTAQFLISGYDLYGYPMTQLLTGASGADATTLKAFKYIASVVPQGTLSGSTVTVGTTDTWGLPLAVNAYAYADITWAGTNIGVNTGFTAAVTTSPATNLTGDVRGTYANQGAASNGTNALQLLWTPSVAQISGGNNSIYGVPQS
jgi:hypothetical protein